MRNRVGDLHQKPNRIGPRGSTTVRSVRIMYTVPSESSFVFVRLFLCQYAMPSQIVSFKVG